MHHALALRYRLPEINKLMTEGTLSARLANTIAWRTQLVDDPDVLAQVDGDLAEVASSFGSLSVPKLEAAIDAAIAVHDPAAVRRFQTAAKGCDLEFGSRDDSTGTVSMWGRLKVTDAELFERRVEQMARRRCSHDPRTAGERRTAVLGVIGAGGTHLPCTCGRPDCTATGPDARADAIVIHVLTDHQPDAGTPHDLGPGPDAGPDTAPPPNVDPPDASPPPHHGPDAGPPPDTDLDPGGDSDSGSEPGSGPGSGSEPDCGSGPGSGSEPGSDPDFASGPDSGREPGSGPAPAPTPQPAAKPERAECRPKPETRTGASGLAVIAGGGIVPAALLGELIDLGATVRPVPTAAELCTESRYRPSAKLARYVRSRDLTCCFPGCDRPAERCDLDHSAPHGVGGLTHPGNAKCLCRKHHLLKTFWTGPTGWTDQQLADGTIVWISPTGHRYTRPPGSRMYFPHWDTHTPLPKKDTATPPPAAATGAPNRGLTMPKRKTTRGWQRALRLHNERQRNQRAIDEDTPPY